MSPNAPARPAAPARARAGSAVLGYVLRVGTAGALVVDAVVHWGDAAFYDTSTQSLLSQGQLFRIQAVVALVVAAAVMAWPRRLVWVIAFLVAAGAVGAVTLYTYVDVGSIAGLPDMYEPSWGPPGKVLSALAEGSGALVALAGLAWSIQRRRPA